LESGLPINLASLFESKIFEENRVEYKSTWDEYIKMAVVRSVAAYANDFFNLGGGYIVIGVETDENGKAILPPKGLNSENLDLIQREIIGACKGKISPEYIPLIFTESMQGKHIIIIWVPAGDNRPYEAPKRNNEKGRAYFIRIGSTTIEATGDTKRQLIANAKIIPFDDRRSLSGKLEDISPILVKNYLTDIRSHLVEQNLDIIDIFRKLHLLVKINDHEIPRNVALLFFNDDPEKFFKGSRIDVVQFGDDAGGDLIEENYFRGPLHHQIKSTLQFLDGLGGVMLKKISGQSEVEKHVPYPYEAMEEAIVNAVYHRGYDDPPEPIKVYLYPNRMEITSYPGPQAGIKLEHFEPLKSVPPVQSRNRRIGSFLKDLRLAESRGTGIPKIHRRMRENGSPDAKFDFDEDHTYFRVILPVHPRYQILHALREAASLWATGEKNQAIELLIRNYEIQKSSGALSSQIIEYSMALDDVNLSLKTLKTFDNQKERSEETLPYLTLSRLLLDKKMNKQAKEIIKLIPPPRKAHETKEKAILLKKTGNLEEAHKLFSEAYSLEPDNPELVLDLAQTKLRLASRIRNRRGYSKKTSHLRTVYKRLNKEASELLRKSIQLKEDIQHRAWSWCNLGIALDRLRAPKSEVETAFLTAISLQPDDLHIKGIYENWKSRSNKG